MADGTGPGKDEIKASVKQFGESLPPIKVTATNPIDEAYVAEVRAQIQSLETEALEIPVNADTDTARYEIETALNDLREKAGIDVSLDAPGAAAFSDEVLADIEALRLRIGALVVPIEANTSALGSESLQGDVFYDDFFKQRFQPMMSGYRQAPRLGLNEAGLSGELGNPVDVAAAWQQHAPQSVMPSYTPAPMFAGGQDPYAAAKAQLATEPPLVIPTRAQNPIDDAFVAQVRSSVRAIAVDALKIPAVPELEEFQAQLEETLAQLSETSRLDVPVDVGDAMVFREQVAQLVQQVQQSTKAVISVQVDDTGLSDLQAKTVAAAQSSNDLVQAEQKLNAAMASGDEDKIAKARSDVVAATKAEQEATQELTDAQRAAGVAAVGLGEAEDTAAAAGRGLGAAMGPLWMVMNVVQVAAMGMGMGMFGAGSQAQNLTSQIVSLGAATGSSAANMLSGNQALSDMNNNLIKVGSSSAAFSQAAQGVQSFSQYSAQLQAQQSSLGGTMASVTEQVQQNSRAGQEQVSTTKTVTESIAQLAQAQADGRAAGMDISQSTQDQIDKFNAYAAVMPAVKQELQALQAQQALENAQLQAAGFTMSATGQIMNSYGLGVQQLAKDFADATAGLKYMEDSQDKASITAGQGAQQWTQLQAAVTSAGQAYTQSENAVTAARHGVETASQGVTAAIHSEQQATQAVTSANNAYTNAVYQETQAEAAVTAARAAAEQQLVSLNLAANDAAASVDSANVSLYNAQQNALKYGVNAGNVQQIAGTTNITAANVAQVTAAQQLLAAENALADAQNSSTQAQTSLNTARQQGVANNPAVLAAEHALTQSQQAVQSASQGVANAQWAQQQSTQAVTNAEWSEQQAQSAVNQAKQAALASLAAYNAAVAAEGLSTDGITRSIDANTLAGAQNRQAIEGVYDAYVAAYGPTQTATDLTETAGEKMGFTSGQIHDVIDNLSGLNGMNVKYDIQGTPTLDLGGLFQAMAKANIDPYSLGLNNADVNLAMGPVGSSYAVGGAASGGLSWVGEDGPELVTLPPGSSVHPHANSMQMAANGDVPPLHRAAGGPVAGSPALAALGVNAQLAIRTSAYDVAGSAAAFTMGAQPPQLPAATAVDLGPYASMGIAGGGARLSGNAAANRAIMQSVFSRFGWGSGPEWAAQDYVEMREAGYNNYAQNPTSTAFGMGQFLDCVPLDAEILTQDGWKTWDTVRVGDRTLGYNPTTGRSEWTPILAKVLKPAQRVVRMSVGNWSARVTPGHRWMSERRTTQPAAQHAALTCPECGATRGKRGPFRSSRAVQAHLGRVHGLTREQRPYVRVQEFVRTDSITKAHRLRVAAEVDDAAGNDTLSDAEVALLGWIVGDGHINHRNRTVNVWIYQAKARFVPVIDALLDGIPHSRYTRDRRPGKHLPSVEWRLSSPYARDLLRRSKILEETPDDFVLSLSNKQRDIWLDAVWQAEGWTIAGGQNGNPLRRLSQNVGPWADAMTLAAYLCGFRPTRHLNNPHRTNPKHHDNWVITLGRPWIGGTEIVYEDEPEQPVWCVNTELGTWTMRQNGLPMLTGNSTWAGYGYSKTADPYIQSEAMAVYERDRYGDPIGAAAHERAFNWYRGGGPAGGWIGVGEDGPELLRVPNGSSVTPHANAMSALASQPVEVSVKIEFGAGADGAFASAFKNLVRAGQIRFTAPGAQVQVS